MKTQIKEEINSEEIYFSYSTTGLFGDPRELICFYINYSAAKTIQDFKKWGKGENLIENSSFEDGIAAWNLEDRACYDRGGQYEWEVEEKDAFHG